MLKDTQGLTKEQIELWEFASNPVIDGTKTKAYHIPRNPNKISNMAPIHMQWINWNFKETRMEATC